MLILFLSDNNAGLSSDGETASTSKEQRTKKSSPVPPVEKHSADSVI